MVPFILITLLYFMGFSVADDSSGLEIRGQIATGNFEWTSKNFAGFYYDIDDERVPVMVALFGPKKF
jgi:hypothetical protein